MADEDDYEEVERQQVVVERPTRAIRVKDHDTLKDKTEEIIELTQGILDTMPEEYSHKDIAIKIKRKLDETQGGTWQVIVGTHFGGNVTNEEGTLVNFQINGVYFLVLRSGPPERPSKTQVEE